MTTATMTPPKKTVRPNAPATLPNIDEQPAVLAILDKHRKLAGELADLKAKRLAVLPRAIKDDAGISWRAESMTERRARLVREAESRELAGLPPASDELAALDELAAIDNRIAVVKAALDYTAGDLRIAREQAAESLGGEIREVVAPLVRESVLTYLRALAAAFELDRVRMELAGRHLPAHVASAGLPHMAFSPQLIGGGQTALNNIGKLITAQEQLGNITPSEAAGFRKCFPGCG